MKSAQYASKAAATGGQNLYSHPKRLGLFWLPGTTDGPPPNVVACDERVIVIGLNALRPRRGVRVLRA